MVIELIMKIVLLIILIGTFRFLDEDENEYEI